MDLPFGTLRCLLAPWGTCWALLASSVGNFGASEFDMGSSEAILAHLWGSWGLMDSSWGHQGEPK